MVAIVGYTNAGKSTLLNTLTGSDVLAENKLFATLDTRSRRLRFPEEREVVLTDTVGFIRDLPKDLFAAFRATFEEAGGADLLLHVLDASDPARDEHARTTETLLADLSLDGIPRIDVFNKADLLPPGEGARLVEGRDDAVLVSALHRETTRKLLLTDRRAPRGALEGPPSFAPPQDDVYAEGEADDAGRAHPPAEELTTLDELIGKRRRRAPATPLGRALIRTAGAARPCRWAGETWSRRGLPPPRRRSRGAPRRYRTAARRYPHTRPRPAQSLFDEGRGSEGLPRAYARVRAITLSARRGRARPSRSWKTSFTLPGSRRSTRPARVAPAAFAASRMRGTTSSTALGDWRDHHAHVGCRADARRSKIV